MNVPPNPPAQEIGLVESQLSVGEGGFCTEVVGVSTGFVPKPAPTIRLYAK